MNAFTQAFGKKKLATEPQMLVSQAVIGLLLLLVTVLHYSTWPGLRDLHAIYRFFYFLPIVYAALRFGFWGGLLASLAASLLFAPHIFFKWGNFPEDGLNDLLVIVVFYGVAIITGLGTDRLRESQAEQAQTASDLALSLHRLEAQGEELRRAERLSSLGTLAGGLAHEIRNPVGIIRATAQLIEMECGPNAAESVGIIQQETDRVERLVQELLTFAGDVEIDPRPTDVRLLLEQVRRRLEPLAIGSKVALDFTVSSSLPLVALDARRMEEALVNLCMNSLQALDGPGTIAIDARQIDDNGAMLEVRVSDDGPGIPDSVLPLIFDPFFTTKDDGVGLGLSVVQRIVEDHGGRIWATNRAEGGAAFVIRIPLDSRGRGPE